MSEHPIFTIGYGRLTVVDLMKFIALNLIDTVVDVRSVPYSRISPQFNKNNMEVQLPEYGIEYRFAGKYLGGFPRNRRPAAGEKVDWEAMAATPRFKRGIKRLIELQETKRMVLLCAEENPYRCHRHHLITPFLVKAGIQVIHLRHNGVKIIVSEIQDTLFH